MQTVCLQAVAYGYMIGLTIFVSAYSLGRIVRACKG